MGNTQKIVCPNCGESNYSRSNDTSFISGHGGWYHCNLCGKESPIFPLVEAEGDAGKEVVEDAPKLEKHSNPPKLGVKKIFVILLITFTFPFSMFFLPWRKK